MDRKGVCVCVWVDRWMDGCVGGWIVMHRWMDGWMEDGTGWAWIDGWAWAWMGVDGWMDEWLDEWMNG